MSTEGSRRSLDRAGAGLSVKLVRRCRGNAKTGPVLFDEAAATPLMQREEGSGT